MGVLNLGMSLYADYILEREGRLTLETEDGFLNYAVLPECVYFGDIYVKPEARKKGHAKFLCDEVVKIAKQLGHTKIMSTVETGKTGSTDMLVVHAAYGFEVLSADKNIIYFVKNI